MQSIITAATSDLSAITHAATANWFWTVIGVIVVVWIAFATVESIMKSLSRERSRREIAAYIAEGSMTPEQGERLLRGDKGGCP